MHQGFEQEAKRFEVAKEAIRVGAQCSDGKRRIDKVPLGGAAQHGAGERRARRPRRLLFVHHQALQCVQIGSHRVRIEWAAVAARIRSEGTAHSPGVDTFARQRTEDAAYVAGGASHAIHA